MSKNDEKINGTMALNVVLGGFAAIVLLMLFSFLSALLISGEKLPYSGGGDYVTVAAFFAGLLGCIFYRVKNGKYNVLIGCLGVALFVAIVRFFVSMFAANGGIFSWDNLKVDLALLVAAVLVGIIKVKKKRSRR